MQHKQDCQQRSRSSGTATRFRCTLECCMLEPANHVGEAVALPPDSAAPWNAACLSLQRLEKQRQYNQDTAERRLRGSPSSRKKAKAFGGGAPRKVVLNEVFMGKCPLCLMLLRKANSRAMRAGIPNFLSLRTTARISSST